MLKILIELISTVLILLGFELYNRKSIKAFFVMGLGQFLAMIICGIAELWYLAFMHFAIFLMQIRGFSKWKNDLAK